MFLPLIVPVGTEGLNAHNCRQEFTMDMMLKTLHIDPQVIGFDISGQRWIKD